jgi:two-component system LytT family response regulator
VRVLIVDDEALARDRLRSLLAAEDGVAVAGECANGDEAVAALRRGTADLVFLDVQMPGRTHSTSSGTSVPHGCPRSSS